MRNSPSLEAYERSGLLGCLLNTLELIRNGDRLVVAICGQEKQNQAWVL